MSACRRPQHAAPDLRALRNEVLHLGLGQDLVHPGDIARRYDDLVVGEVDQGQKGIVLRREARLGDQGARIRRGARGIAGGQQGVDALDDRPQFDAFAQQPELQLGGLVDQGHCPVDVLQSRQLDDDAVFAFLLDDRFGDAEFVDAVRDDLHGPFHHVDGFLLRQVGFVHLKLDVHAALEIQAQADGLVLKPVAFALGQVQFLERRPVLRGQQGIRVNRFGLFGAEGVLNGGVLPVVGRSEGRIDVPQRGEDDYENKDDAYLFPLHATRLLSRRRRVA